MTKTDETDPQETDVAPLTLDGLLTQLKAKGLVPVFIEEGLSLGREAQRPELAFDGGLPNFIDTGRSILSFGGELSGFIDTAAALGIKAIFVSASEFYEHEFYYEAKRIRPPSIPRTTPSARNVPSYKLVQSGLTPDQQPIYRREPIPEPKQPQAPPPRKEETEQQPIDLRTKEPRLKAFVERVSEHCGYLLFFSCGEAIIHLHEQEDWYTKFKQLKFQIIWAIEKERDTEIMAQRKKEEEEQKRREEEETTEQTRREEEETSVKKKQEEELAAYLSNIKQTLLNDQAMMFGQNHYSITNRLQEEFPELESKVGPRGVAEFAQSLREELAKRRAPEQQKRAEFIKQLASDESFFLLPQNDTLTIQAYLQEKYTDAAKNLDHRGVIDLVLLFRDEFEKRRRVRQIQREAERRQLSEEQGKFKKDCDQKLAALRQTLPDDTVLMSSQNKISMRAYLLDKHPELFGVLLPIKRDQDDFINWLNLQKQKKRV